MTHPSTIEEQQEAVDWLLATYFSASHQRDTKSNGNGSGLDATDDELLQRAFDATNGAKLRRLWNGDTTDYPSASEADLGLASLLAFWTGHNAVRLEGLMRGSKLVRDKWDTRHYSDGGTYLHAVISKALSSRTEFYTAGAHANGNAEKAEGDQARAEGASSLAQAIRAIILDKEVPPFDKRRRVAGLVEDGLRGCGTFYRTTDGRAFFFFDKDRSLLELDQRTFQYFLTTFSGLSATEGYFRFTLDLLQAAVSRQAQVAHVHTLAAFNPATGLQAVSDGGSGLWYRERGGAWQLARNGDHGFLFLTEPDAEAWIPELSGDTQALEWFADQFLFADTHSFTREDQRTLYLVWLLHQFFPSLRRTRVIPACLGPQGSGKTTAERLTGRLLLGPSFEVTGIHREREDAFIAAVTNRVMYGLDNADSRVPWFEDAIARYATGERYRLRRLYTTNDEVSYAPRAILMLSSRDPHFNRPDVSERLLPLYFERPSSYKPEKCIYSELESRRGAIVGAVLHRIAEIADGLPTVATPSLPFRMADFASFGWQVAALMGLETDWEKLLARLECKQAEFASAGDGIIESLRLVLAQGALTNTAVSDLFRRCQAVAEEQRLVFPRTVQTFGQRLSNLRRVIELELGVKFQEERGHGGVRRITLAPKCGDDGGDGDDGSRNFSPSSSNL